MWLFASSAMVMVLPVVESRSTIVRTTRMVWKDLLGLGGSHRMTATEGRTVDSGGDVSDSAPNEKVPGSVDVKKAD